MLLVDSRSIVKYHPKPNTPMKIKENIFFFIEAVADMGVPKQKLFAEEDLEEEKNLLKVLDCLESFAEIAVKNGFAIPLEPIKDDETDFLDEQLASAAAMLAKIKTKIQDGHPHSIANRQLSYQITSKGADAHKVENTITHLQALYRARATRKLFKKKLRMQVYRTSAAKEILSTEEQFVSNLKLLQKLFKQPLHENAISKKHFITEEEVKGLFSDIEIILGYNSQLLEDLVPRIQHWNASQCLGDIFLKIISFLKVYTTYVKQYDHALEILNNLKKNSKFEEFCEKQRENPESHGLTLEMLLIMPIQRSKSLLSDEQIPNGFSSSLQFIVDRSAQVHLAGPSRPQKPFRSSIENEGSCYLCK